MEQSTALALRNDDESTDMVVLNPELIEEADFVNLTDDNSEPTPAKNNTIDYKVVAVDVQEELSDEEKKRLAEKIVGIALKIKSMQNSLESLKFETSTLRKSIDKLNEEQTVHATDYEYGKKNLVYSCYTIDNYELNRREYIDVVTKRVIKTEPFPEGSLPFTGKSEPDNQNENPEDEEDFEDLGNVDDDADTPDYNDDNDEVPFG